MQLQGLLEARRLNDELMDGYLDITVVWVRVGSLQAL
jgi:hypothetical protein